MEQVKPLSRSEREAKIKDKAGWAITVIAAALAINTYFGNTNSSKILNNTISANDTWSFYQAKSIKQSIAELSLDQTNDKAKKEKLQAKIDRYETDPKTGEGKKELFAKARVLEEERNVAKKNSPWYTFAGSALQISIVLLSAAILSVSMGMFWGSIGVGAIGILLVLQALFQIL